MPRMLRSLVERKVYGQTATTGDIVSNTTSQWFYLNTNIGQGDGIGAREGRTVTITKLQLRGRFSNNGTSTSATPRHLRLLLLIDKVPSQANPSITEIISASEPQTFGFRAWNESFRYKVLKDKKFTINLQRDLVPSTDAVSALTYNRDFSFSIPMKLRTEWASTTGSVDNSQMTKNSLLFVVFSDFAANSHVKMQYTSRVQYVDL